MRESVINVVTLLGIFGIPSIFSMTLWCIRECRKYTKQLKILMKAQQSQMRSQLLAQFNDHMAHGYISDEDMEDWENQYQSYHALGQNGVLDKKRDILLSLPSKR